jgi:hypothetical protein
MEYKFRDLEPEKEYYSIFHNKNGDKEYYLNDMMLYLRYKALYGRPEGLWTYEPEEGCKVCTGKWVDPNRK